MTGSENEAVIAFRVELLETSHLWALSLEGASSEPQRLEDPGGMCGSVGGAWQVTQEWILAILRAHFPPRSLSPHRAEFGLIVFLSSESSIALSPFLFGLSQYLKGLSED